MTDETPTDLLAKLSQALITVSRGDPIISLRTEIGTQLRSVDTRFEAIEKATELQHQDMVRVPTQVDRAVDALEKLMISDLGTAIAKVEGKFNTLIAVTEGNFKTAIAEVDGKIEKQIGETAAGFVGVNNQFSQNDKALTAALQAQEKQAIATNDSNTAASTKMEAGFTALFKQQLDILTEVRRTYDVQFTAINSRLDKKEGSASVSDPQLAATLAGLAAGMTAMQDTMTRNMSKMTDTTATALNEFSTSLRKVERTETSTTARGMGRGEIVSYITMGILVLSQIIVMVAVFIPHAGH